MRSLVTTLRSVTALLITFFSLQVDASPLLSFERFNAVFENDAFFRIDRWYTSGNDYSFLFKSNSDLLYFPFVDHADDISYVAFGVSLEMYTPSTYNDPEPNLNDRPYAGWLYSSFALHQSNSTTLNSLELQLGIVGPSAKAENVQRFMHDYVLGDPVDGWQNQLHDEFGINLAYFHHERLTSRVHSFDSQFITRMGGVIGNVRTEFDLGLQWRIGRNVPADFGQNFVMMPGLDSGIPALNKDQKDDIDRKGFFVQLQSDLRLVGRDMFLEGNSDGNSLSVEPYPVVGRFGGGFGGTYANYTLSVLYTAESKSFTQQSKIHGYGSLLFSYRY